MHSQTHAFHSWRFMYHWNKALQRPAFHMLSARPMQSPALQGT